METTSPNEIAGVLPQNGKHFLLCRVGTQLYGFAVEQVCEVLTGVQVHAMPIHKRGIHGLVAIRGHICPLTDIGLCLPVPADEPMQAGSCLVVCEARGFRFCIRVSEVIHVVHQSEMSAADSCIAGSKLPLITHITRVDDKVVLIVELNEFIQHICPSGGEACCD